MKPHPMISVLCILYLATLYSASTEGSIKPIATTFQRWDKHISPTNKLTPQFQSTRMKAPGKDGEESEETKSGEDEEDDIMMEEHPKKDNGAKGSGNGNNKKSSGTSSDDEDDVMKDLFNPNKTSGTPKPTVVMNGNGKNKKPIGASKPPEEPSRSDSPDDLKAIMDSAMAKATSIATNIGDALKAAMNSVATALKNATEVTEKTNATANSSASCQPPKNCSGSEQQLETIIMTSTNDPSKGNIPIPATTTTRRQRRNSEVAKWPPQLPYAYGPHEVHLFHTAVTEGNMRDKDTRNKNTNAAAPNTEGGIISHGQVGSEEESGSGEDVATSDSHHSSSSGSVTGNSEANEEDEDVSNDDDSSGTEEDKSTVTYSPEDDTEEEVTKPSTSGSGNGSSFSKVGGSGERNNNTGGPAIKSTVERNVSLTVTGQGDSMGSSSVSSSSSSSASAFPSNQAIKKPGKCRPLTKGLSCIALSPDASQCSTDNGCPGTKKCCYYGCPPYTGVGICEFPMV